MRTIVLIPVHQATEFFNETAKHLYKLDPQPDLYIFTENNSTDRTLDLIQQFDRPKKVIRLQFPDEAARSGCLRAGKPDGTVHDVIGAIRQTLLQAARQVDPDFAILLDSDVRVRSYDLIRRLTRWSDDPVYRRDQVDIVCGPIRRHSPWGTQFAAFRFGSTREEFHTIENRPPLTRILDEVLLAGGGCMCLPRSVIQDKRLYFYPVIHPELGEENTIIRKQATQANFPIPNFSEDVAFSLHARKLGYRFFLDWSVFLDHWVDDRTKPWTVTHPDDPPETGVGTWLLGD